MSSRRFFMAACSVAAAFATILPAACLAQATTSGSKAASTRSTGAETGRSDSAGGEGGAPGQIVIRRQAIHLRAPERYQVSMQLEPIREVRLAAPFDGRVSEVFKKPVKPGDNKSESVGEMKVESGGEVIRMDTTEQKFLVDRAKALYKIAQIESQRGGAGGSELADARLQAAKAELDLAVFRMEQGSIRAPFDGELFGINVSQGQIVRMGDTLATVGQTNMLKTEIPVDRNSASVGQSFQIKVEDRTVPATVETILPLASRFEPLRELLPSAASAVILVTNADGRLKVGQTVFVPLVPREPVAEVPNSAIGNLMDASGSHKVQVLRGNVVRDVPVTALAPVGSDRSFVSGTFDPADELIVWLSQELTDGTPVRAAAFPVVQQTLKPGTPSRPGVPPSGEASPETPGKRSGGL